MICEVLPGIWLGNKDIATNINFLNKKNIKCVINISKEIEHCKLYSGEKIRIPVDNPVKSRSAIINGMMYDYLNDATEFMKKKNNNFDPILVYCSDGEQRSATVICAYIMKYGKVTADLSIKYLISKVPNVFSMGIYFYSALKKFEK